MNTAARNNSHITVISDIEIIVNSLCKTCLTYDNGDMHAFSLGPVSNTYIYTRLILFGSDLNMLRRTSSCTLTVGPYKALNASVYEIRQEERILGDGVGLSAEQTLKRHDFEELAPGEESLVILDFLNQYPFKFFFVFVHS